MNDDSSYFFVQALRNGGSFRDGRYSGAERINARFHVNGHDMREDRRDLNNDRRELSNDRSDMRHDRHEMQQARDDRSDAGDNDGESH